MTQIEQRRPPIRITADAFKGEPGVRALLPLVRTLKSILPLGREFGLKTVLGEKSIPEGVILEQSTIVNKKAVRLFDPNQDADSGGIILAQLKTANEVVGHISTKLGLRGNEQHDEQRVPDPLLLRSMHLYLVDKVDKVKISPQLKYGLRRQLLLAALAAPIHMRTANDKSYEFLSELQNELNDNFFYHNIQEGILVGSVQNKMFITTHVPSTNEVITVEEVAGKCVLKSNEKLARGQFRKVKLDDDSIVDVYSHDRKKSDVESIIKAIAKADGGVIDPIQEIKDSIGKQFVVNGDNKIRDEVLEKYIAVMKKKYPGLRVEPDNLDNENPEEFNRGQSKKILFNRVKLFFKGKSAPYEVICYSLKDYLNSKLEVGQEKGGIYDGQAHALYELRRLVKVTKVLLQNDFDSETIDSYARIQMQGIAGQLLSMKDVDILNLI